MIMEKYSPNKKFIVMTRDEVRAFDSWAINTLGMPGVVLMENAGRSCAELIEDKLSGVAKPKACPPSRPPEASGGRNSFTLRSSSFAVLRRMDATENELGRRVCIFCGTGNNGGDGYVITRHLLNKSFKVAVVLCGDRNKIKGDAKINLDILERMGQPIERLNITDQDISNRVRAYTEGTDMIVDALFGTGLSGQLSDEYKLLIENINAQNCPILAVDIPSGLDCDTGEPLGAAIRATYTMTFVAMKKGFTVSSNATQYTGEIFVASIGVEPKGRTPG
jgi:NAD(P)H-hydrate epimerase